MAAAMRSAWAGAIQFGGFSIHLRAYPLVQSRSAQSFKNLCACHGAPVVMPKRCSVDDKVLDASELVKGHQTGKDQYVPIPPEAAETLRSAESTELLEIKQLAPLASLPMHLITGHYRMVPNDKVPGSSEPVQVLWNGLSASGRAVVTEWIPRAGSRDSLLVIHADAFGLTGNTLPYKSELRDTGEFKPVENEKAAAMFEQFAGVQGIDMDDFAYSRFESQYEARRTRAIELALSGEPITAAIHPKAEDAPAPDLMAAMMAAVDAKPAGKSVKRPAKAKAKKGTVAA